MIYYQSVLICKFVFMFLFQYLHIFTCSCEVHRIINFLQWRWRVTLFTLPPVTKQFTSRKITNTCMRSRMRASLQRNRMCGLNLKTCKSPAQQNVWLELENVQLSSATQCVAWTWKRATLQHNRMCGVNINWNAKTKLGTLGLHTPHCCVVADDTTTSTATFPSLGLVRWRSKHIKGSKERLFIRT